MSGSLPTVGTSATGGFILGTAANYAVIAFAPANFQETSDSPINGNVGIGAITGTVQQGNGKITGNLDFTGAAQTNTGGTVTGSINGNVMTLSNDISALQSMSSTFAGETGTVENFASGSVTLQASSGTLIGGNEVFTTTTLTDNTHLTINGSGANHVVINVTSDFKIGDLTLTGGLTANEVLINYTGSTELHGTNKDVFEGTILDTGAKVNVDGSTITGHLYGGAPGQDFQFVSNATITSIPPVCFMAGTSIRISAIETARVEDLVVGDLVLTSDGRQAPVLWVGRQTVSMTFADPLRVLPIRITAGALGDNLPTRDLLVSSSHAILVGDILIQAGALVNGTSIVRETNVPNTFVYYHVELADHSLLLAEGVPAESFLDGVDIIAFDNWQERVELYPEGREMGEMPYPRAKSARQVPMAIRQHMAMRAAASADFVALAA